MRFVILLFAGLAMLSNAEAADGIRGYEGIAQFVPLALIGLVIFVLFKISKRRSGTLTTVSQYGAGGSVQNSNAIRLRNPSNGYEEELSHPGLWCLLFGGLYFAYKGVWGHAIIGLALAVLTAGISWFIYPFFAKRVIVQHYLRQGWQIS